MVVATNKTSMPVKTVSLKDAVFEYKKKVKSYEKKYGCKTKVMLDSVESGKSKETMDVARWFFNYRTLVSLESKLGHTTGIHTKTI